DRPTSKRRSEPGRRPIMASRLARPRCASCSSTSGGRTRGGMAILIADDDPEARARLERALRESGDGWDVCHAASAKEALALVTRADVECVLLDYRLPDADGLSCLRELRRVRPDVPVLMVTGSGSEEVAVEAMKCGVGDYVVKHATYAQVVPGRVRELLGRRARARLKPG